MTEENTNNKVAKPTADAAEFAELVKLPRTLLKGTRGMRAAGAEYLPQNPSEHKDQYTRRINATFLFNGFARAVQMLTGKVFSSPVVLDEDVLPDIEEWAKDVDLEGRDLTTYAEDWFRDSVISGMSHTLVDFQRNSIGEGATLADEREAGLRPYLTMIPADRVVGWRTMRRKGASVLSQFRYLESVSVSDGLWGTRQSLRVRVYYAGNEFLLEDEDGRYAHFEVWEKAENKDEWKVIDSGDMKPFVDLPIVTHYTNRQSFMKASPPLEDLCWKNVEHWNSASEQRNILHVSRVPILFGKG